VLDAIGNIGDFVGGIGVVVTLLYLAGQIRQNTRSVRSSAFEAAQRDLSEVIDHLSSDPELIRIYFDGNRDFASFSQDDRRRYASFMAGFMRRYETLVYQTRVGNIDPKDWEGVRENLRETFQGAGTRAWWAGARSYFNSELQEYVERECLESAPSNDKSAA
jgi:hypothetical protein